MIYLDNAATAKVLPKAMEVATQFNLDFYNPSALYSSATKIKLQIEAARSTIARHLNCTPSEIYFTSGATEANNWAIFSSVKNKNMTVVTSEGEHASVYESFTALKNQGVKTNFIGLNSDTSINQDSLFNVINNENAAQIGFVSMIHASNETGKINDISSIYKKIRQLNSKVILHADGVQAFGKIETDVKKLGVDLYSISGHKVGAPKGVGALYIKKGVNLKPLIYGGGQENKMRSGTENVSAILSFATAIEQYYSDYKNCDSLSLKKTAIDIITNVAGNVTLNGSIDKSLNHIISLSVGGIRAEILQRMLADKDNILIGLGSSCASSKRNNRILQSAGKSKADIEGNIRISFSPDMTIETVKEASNKIAQRIIELRGRHIG